MGDAQSAQRGEQQQDAGEAGEAGGDAHTELHVEHKSFKSDGQISEFTGNADSSIVEIHCEDKITAEAILSPDGDVSETEEICQEETPLVNVEINDTEAPDANEDVCLDLTEMDAKQNDINESFKRFFSNIGLKFTVKKGSTEPATDETNKDEPNRSQEDPPMETMCENTDVNIAQEAYDNDSTTCPTLTDGTSEGVLENAETKEEVESDRAMSPEGEDATPEEEPHATSPSRPEVEEVVLSPIKRFFTTGIFSGIRKKKKVEDEELADKELKDMGNKEDVEKTEQKDMEEVSLSVEAGEHEEPNGEPEILSSQEKVQASPLKRLLSGSNLKKLSKRQRSRRSSDAKLSDSGEHVSDHLVSSTESAGKQVDKGSGQPPAEVTGEDGAWASFKKLLTPKRRLKKYSLTNDETQIPGPEEPKPSDGGQIPDNSTEEGKKRKDSAVSWEAVLCGSGRRRSRKTSDSEDDSPQDANKQNVGSKQGPELVQENDINEISASKQAGSPAEADGASTWKSLKRLVTPKRKAKDDAESKDNVQSDSEVPQDESFSVKKILSGRKKRKSTEARPDQVSSDEADKDATSGDEDSETPAVVPLSEFDTFETEVQVQTQADVESPKEADHEEDLLDQMDEPVPPPGDGLKTEEVQAGALETEASKTPAADEEAEDLTDSISKPQLSDIPEEATPASATEEAARDDTIAEDLIEITSDAVTAPEPLDTPLADETEMISAVSQLSSESSKTSGNTTPVPADYVVKETDVLLHQVIETISSPKEGPVCSDEPRSENIAISELHETLEKFDEERPTVLEIHRSLDATKINTGLNAEPDAVNELTATVRTENIPEFSNSLSTDTVSEVPTEEFKTAEIAVDDIYSVDVTNPDESIGELESVDSLLINHLVECPSEGNVEVYTDILPESEDIVPDDGFLVQTEKEVPKLDSQEATVTGEGTDGTRELDEDQPPVELLESAVVRVDTLDSEEGSTQSLEKDVKSEDTTTAETVTYELKEETVPLPEGKEYVQEPEVSEAVQTSTLDAEEGSVQSPNEGVKSEEPKETEYEVSAEPQDEELPVTTTQVVVAQADKEENNGQSLEKQTILENVPEGKTEVETIQASLEPADATTPEHVQESEVLDEVQAQALDSEAGDVLSLEKDLISEDIPSVATDEPDRKQEVEPEEKLPTEDVQEPQVLEGVSDSEEGSVQPLEKEVISEMFAEGQTRTLTDESKEPIPPTDTSLKPVGVQLEGIPAVEKVQHQPKQEAEAKPEEEPPVEAGKTDVQEDQLEVKDIVTETTTEGTLTDLVTDVRASDQKQEKQILLEGKLDHSLEVSENQKAKSISQDVGIEQESRIPEVIAELQTAVSLLNEDTCNVQDLEETISTENSQAPLADNTTLISEPENGVHLSVIQARVEEEKESEIPENEINTAVVEHVKLAQAVLCNFKEVSAETSYVLIEEASPVTEATIERQTSELQLKEEVETVAPLETDLAETAVEGSVVVVMNVPSVLDASKIDLHGPEVLEGVVPVPVLDSEEGSGRVLEKEEVSENVPEGEMVPDKSEEETIPLTEANLEPVDATKLEQVQEPEVLKAVQVQVPSLEKEVTSEVIPVGKVTDEPKEETIPLTEASTEPVDATKTEQVQEPEAVEAVPIVPVEMVQVQIPHSEAGNLSLVEKEVTSEVIPVGETVTEEQKTLSEASPETADVTKPEQLQEPEVIGLSLEQEVTSEVIPAVTDEPKLDAEVEPEEILSVEAVNTEVVQDPQILEGVQDSKESNIPSLEKEAILENVAGGTTTNEPKQEAEATQEGTEDVHEPQLDVKDIVLQENFEGVQKLEKQILLEDIPKPNDKVASVPDGLEGEVMAQLDHYLDIVEDQKMKSTPHDVGTEQDNRTSEVIDKLQTSASHVPDPEKTPKSPTSCVDIAAFTHEPEHEVHLGAVHSRVEEEKEIELPGIDVTTATFDHAIVTQVVICNFKEVSAEIPDVLIEQTSPISIPLVYHVPSVECQDKNHRIQVQVVDDAESAEVTGDVVLAQIAEKTEPADGPCETVEKLDQLSATPETEEEVTNEENNVTIHEVVQHVKEPEAVPELVTLEQVAFKQLDAVTEVKESVVTTKEVQEEASVVTEQQVSEDLLLQPDVPASLDVPTQVQNLEKCEGSAEFTSNEIIYEKSQMIKHQILTPRLAGGISSVAEPVSGAPITQRSEPSEKSDMSEVRIPAGVEGEPVKTNIHVKLMNVAFQATVTTEPAAELESKEKVVITTQTALLAMGQVEQIDSEMEIVTTIVQAMEMPQPETRDTSMSQEVISERVDGLVRQKEEDQDVWMDAEEVIYTQEEIKVMSLEPESEPDDKAECGEEVETAPNSKNEEEEVPRVMHTAVETCGTDSEEDFAIALEQPEPESVCVATMK